MDVPGNHRRTFELDAKLTSAPAPVPAPDLGTGGADVDRRHLRRPITVRSQLVTGKPVSQGGIAGRTEATGRGGYYGIREALAVGADTDKLGLTRGLDGKTVAIQGFGNVGYHAASILSREGGAKIVAIGEWDGTISDARGLDPEAVAEHRKKTGSIRNFPGAETLKEPLAVLTTPATSWCRRRSKPDHAQQRQDLRARSSPKRRTGRRRPPPRVLVEQGAIIPTSFNASGVTVSYRMGQGISHIRYGHMGKRAAGTNLTPSKS